MASFKRVNSDYSIITDGDFAITTVQDFGDSSETRDNVIITTHTVRVNGNLDVMGDITYINTTELNITDPFIQLNSADSGVGYFAESGVLTHINETTFAGIRYNANPGAERWEISQNTDAAGTGGTWVPVATGTVVSGAAGANTQVQFNADNEFGASANFTFDSDQSQLTLQGHQVFGNIVAAPAAVANTVALYHNQQAGGGTGLYVKSDTVEEELVSKAKAIVYSIIF